MNQEQRKYLIEQVGNTHQEQLEKLEAELPIKPSLNNYLVAACLDGSIRMQDIDTLKQKIKARVLKFGKDDLLVEEKDEDGYSYRRRSSRKQSFKQEVTLSAEDIFVFPDAYIKAMEEYFEAKRIIDDKIAMLDAQKKTIIMKIQIGSNQVLDKLVTQVDNMADLNIMNSQLLLSQ